MRNVSAQISLRSPRRLIRADTFRLRVIDVKSNDVKSTGGEKFLSELACVACF